VKRSEALASLSRDHHQALFVAQKLRRAGADDADEVRRRFLEFWGSHGREHFRLEEEILLPGYAAHGDAHHPLVLQVLGDHVEIRLLAKRLAADTGADPAALHLLGERLHDHVRLEERRLFPLIEEALPADELAALAQELERAEARPGAP
jgi:hypothetical protein